MSPPNFVDRPRLLSYLDNVDFKKVTIIRAPAGYGKTSVTIQLLQASETPFAWLSLDSKDNDVTRFWSYFVQAFEQGILHFDDSNASSNLQGNDEAKYDFLMNTVLTKLATLQTNFYIVLDDYHFIENTQIHEMMINFIEQLPNQVHLFMTTRVRPPFPLAKWYVKQWVQEISIDQLKFTVNETEKFLIKRNNWDLTYEEVQNITEQTEGWIAALQLFSLHEMNKPLFNEYQIVNEFLIEEIVDSLPDETQQFLYKTSILHELEPSFCRQLTNIEDCEQILAELEEKGLFTIRLHSAQPIYRYHHLFQDVLQQQFKQHASTQDVQNIVKRAATIYENSGDYRSAIELALSNGLYALAQQWLKMYLVPFLQLSEIETFMRWLSELYTHLEAVDIELLIVGFSHAITQNNVALANTYMNDLEERETNAHWMADVNNAPLASIYIRTKAYYYIAIIGDNDAAMRIAMTQLNKPFALNERELYAMPYNAGQYTLLRTPLAGQGRVPLLHEFEDILNLFVNSAYKDLYVSRFGAAIMAEVYFERLSEAKAQPILENILQYGIEHEDDSIIVPMIYLKTNILLTNGQIANAIGILQHALDVVKDPYWKSLINIMLINCSIEEGLLEQAELSLRALKLNNPLWAFTQAKLFLAKKQPEEALKLISYTKEKAIQERQIFTQFEAMIYETLCYIELQQKDVAYATFKNVISIAAKHYYARTLLKHEGLQPLLQQFQTEVEDNKQLITYLNWLNSLNKTDSNIKSLLSQREFTIFDALCKGLTNREIAQSLELSEGTVRIYLSTIYRKLGVNSRAKAILMKDY